MGVQSNVSNLQISSRKKMQKVTKAVDSDKIHQIICELNDVLDERQPSYDYTAMNDLIDQNPSSRYSPQTQINHFDHFIMPDDKFER
jgi:hypothetical protein